MKNSTPKVGELGEQLVAEWLQAQNWVILHHRWRCRWGEIDLIAQQPGNDTEVMETEDTEHGKESIKIQEIRQRHSPPHPVPPSPRHITTSFTASPVLAFIEVKTRSPRNWDADGLLAITPQKQAKLWQAAQLFLAQSPDLANFPCRFDVALVNCQRVSQRSNPERPDILSSSSEAMGKAIPSSSIQLGQPLFRAGYRLILQDYIQSAFD
ncbi:MAG: YraN family protein [Cyanobacteriota bacterium]